MTLDIATRVYNHSFHIDPVIRTLLDTDFYKLLMLQFIRVMRPQTRATFELINRSKRIRLAEVIDERELRDQLDHARTLRFQPNELIWLAGNSFYGTKQIFRPDFLAWLAEFRLPDYELTVVDGQFELRFDGLWCETTMWEIPALSIVNELKSRAALRSMGRLTLDILYAQAKTAIWRKTLRLRALAAAQEGGG